MKKTKPIFKYLALCSSLFLLTLHAAQADIEDSGDDGAEDGAKTAIHTASGHRGENGLGVILGEPTGITGKFWIASHSAIDAGLAYSMNSFMYMYADYLMHLKKPIKTKKHMQFIRQLAPYIGIGGGVGIVNAGPGPQNALSLGVRIPVGIEWLPNDPPLGVFAELVPGISVIPSTAGYIGGGVGVRYYF